MAVGGAMNIIATIGVYAAILKERGEPLHYPGKGSAMLEATDTGVIAQCCEWVLRTPAAQNQCFNITNGEHISLQSEWPYIASCFNMSTGPEKVFSFRNDLPLLAGEWDKVREKYALKSPGLESFLGQSTQFSEFIFARKEGAPSAMSCIKVRKAGFGGMIYADEMFAKWFDMYRDAGLLPPI
jgi:hypothetical protein